MSLVDINLSNRPKSTENKNFPKSSVFKSFKLTVNIYYWFVHYIKLEFISKATKKRVQSLFYTNTNINLT
jgi:hypothetical protein